MNELHGDEGGEDGEGSAITVGIGMEDANVEMWWELRGESAFDTGMHMRQWRGVNAAWVL